jgi:hypothetical protein
VQYPRALNPRLLPPALKQQVTEKWNSWIADAEANLRRTQTSNHIDMQTQIKRATRFGNSVIDYMNSENWYDEHWHEFKNYATALDKFHNTDILDWYPEFKEYW